MSENISKFTFPIIFSLLGLVFLYIAASTDQNSWFIYGALAILLVGIIAALNAAGIIKKGLSQIVAGVLIVASLGLAALDYKSIKDPLDFMKERDRRYQYVIQRLKDIRQAQEGFKSRFGVYADNFNSLTAFLQQDSLNIVKIVGNVPDSLDEFQALALGLVSQDTVRVAAAPYIFNDEYMATRKLGKLYIDSLRYVPFTTSEFGIQAGNIERNKVAVQVFEVIDAAPFDKTKVLKVGSMEDPSTAGNWGE